MIKSWLDFKIGCGSSQIRIQYFHEEMSPKWIQQVADTYALTKYIYTLIFKIDLKDIQHSQ